MTVTESDSRHHDLETKSVGELVRLMHEEYKEVSLAIGKALPDIQRLTQKAADVLDNRGRLFLMGAGTSGRISVQQASECPPTFGTPRDMVIGLIAGGPGALLLAVEGAEDSTTQGFEDLFEQGAYAGDLVIGIAASGTTPYVLHALKKCREFGISTGCVVCNTGTPIAEHSDYAVEVPVGPEFVTGSTRMKAGSVQKQVLDMVTTGAMIRMGRVEGNKMTHLKTTNEKLRNRGVRILMEKTALSFEESQTVLMANGYQVSAALRAFRGKT